MFDTDVIVAALRSDAGVSRRLLSGVLDGRVEALVSVPLMLEYEAVLTRSEHLDAAGLSTQEVGEILDALARLPFLSAFDFSGVRD